MELNEDREVVGFEGGGHLSLAAVQLPTASDLWRETTIRCSTSRCTVHTHTPVHIIILVSN